MARLLQYFANVNIRLYTDSSHYHIAHPGTQVTGSKSKVRLS